MHTFETTAPIAVVFAIPAGTVRLVAADRADTTVDVQPADPGKSRDLTAAQRTSVTLSDGDLHIETGSADHKPLGPSGAVHVTVELPAGSHLDGSAAAVELHTTGRLGDVVVEGLYGACRIDQVASARLSGTDADIEIGALAGSAQITAARGNLRVARAESGTIALTTQSGDIEIGVAADVSASLDASTALGRTTNSLVNTGAATLAIRATTTRGDIVARSL